MKVRVQVEGQTFEVELGDLASRPIQAIVDGKLFAVWPEDIDGVVQAVSAEEPVAVGETGQRPALPAGAEAIVVAPLPGDIVVVAVRPGDRIEAGQLLCTVESMKMNNPVRSTQPGIVEEVLVAVGDHVNYGQPIVRLR